MGKPRFQAPKTKFALCLMLTAFVSSTQFLPGEILAASAPIIINQNCTNLDRVPDYWITQAKKNLRVGYSTHPTAVS